MKMLINITFGNLPQSGEWWFTFYFYFFVHFIRPSSIQDFDHFTEASIIAVKLETFYMNLSADMSTRHCIGNLLHALFRRKAGFTVHCCRSLKSLAKTGSFDTRNKLEVIAFKAISVTRQSYTLYDPANAISLIIKSKYQGRYEATISK